MDINVTNITLTEELIRGVHPKLVIPPLIYAYLFFLIISFIIGIISFDTKSGKNKFLLVWLISVLLSGAFILFLSFKPILISEFTEFVLSWIKF